MQRVELSADEKRFVEEQVLGGHYGNASEVVGAGLRLLAYQVRADRKKLATLRRLAEESFAELDAGDGIVVEDNEELVALIRRIGIEVAAADSTSARDQ